MKKLFLLLGIVLVPAFVFGALGTDETNVVNVIKSIHSLIVVVGVVISAIGFAFGATKMGAGDEFGKKMMIGAVIAILCLLLSKPFVNILIGKTMTANTSNTDVQNVFKN